MNEKNAFKECCSYVAALVQAQDHPKPGNAPRNPPAITISRQAGARGRSIGQKLQNTLREQAPQAAAPWTLFDENLVEKVLEDHDLPTSLAKFMPDDSVSELDSTINEILGRHPSLWTLFEHTVETMVHLCHMGHCILVGRGGNKIAEGLTNVTRVHFVGSPPRRIQQMVQSHGMSPKDAQHFIKHEDRARQRYMKYHFSCDINDPTQYDLIINTDHYCDEAVVQIILHAIAAKQAASG
jgi:hypothetical protein